MHQYFMLLITVAAVCSARAESKLHGSWKSDLDLTSSYLLEHANLDDHQKKSFGILFGRAEITFRPDGTGSVTVAPFDIPTSDGRPLPMAGSRSTFTYAILGESDGQLVIKIETDDPVLKKNPFVLMKFQDRNLYSVEIGDNPFGVHGREFFRRSVVDQGEEGGKAEVVTPKMPSD